MKHNLLSALISQQSFGSSKHEAMAQQGTKFGEAVDGIYSLSTMKAYLDVAVQFSEFVKESEFRTEIGNTVRTLEQAKEYVSAYIEKRMDENKSAWTLKLEASALRKAFGDPSLARDVSIPDRMKENITNSRTEVSRDRNFSEARNQALVDFARGTGLRRSELAVIKPQNVYERNGKVYVEVTSGKGGKYREVPVTREFQERVKVIANAAADQRGQNGRIFEKVNSNANPHSYRAEYVSTMYRDITGRELKTDMAHRQVDKAAAGQVSQALGHSKNRIDVITRNYVRK